MWPSATVDSVMKQQEINLDFSRRQVMTIVNVTPDSFFAGSRTPDWLDVERRVREAVEAGASVIDVGGYSSRPGADEVSPEEEWRRVDLGVGAVRSLSPDLPVSIDTFRSSVAARVIHKYGKVIINDISAGELDPLIVDVAAEHDVPYVAMHMKGNPRTMQSMTDYRDIVAEVVDYFRERTAQLRERGVRRIVVDPGFGFAKTLEQNYELLRGLHRLAELGYPVLAGVSRKSMIYKLLGYDARRGAQRYDGAPLGVPAAGGRDSAGARYARSRRGGTDVRSIHAGMTEREVMIRAEGLRKRYGALEVLRGVSLEVVRGEVVSIVGASGAGKTTLLQIIGSLTRPDGGRVTLGGVDPFALSDRELSRFRNRRVGFVFQFHHLLPEFTAFENVCLPGLIGGRDRREVGARAAELLDLMGLAARRDHKPAALSGGEQQRAAIARALINSPSVLLADEPSGNLDTHNREEIHRLFFELRERLGQTVVIVTHDESLAARADRTITMSDGRIVG